MIVLDVNVVLAAHRADHPHHDVVRPWFDGLTGGDEPFAVPDVVWAGFVRLSTHPRIFEIPSPPDAVFAFLRAVRSHPNHLAVTPGEDHLRLFEELCRRFDATGDLSADAYLASIALEQGASVASLDRDFARFHELRWIRPGDPAEDPDRR